MEYRKIGDIIELHRGYDLPVEQMEKGDVPVVGSNGVVGYHNQEKSISPTVTIGRSGSIGKVHFYDGYTWVHNTALYVSDFKGNDPLYIFYVLKNLDFENLKSSSVVPSLNRNYVYPMKVPFHEKSTDQEKISKTLYAIDQKIALNTRLNAELEAMAKQLYDYWFVQFDFPFDFAQGKPDKNGKPYKSSGGKMVWNEKLKREIPEGWEVKHISDLIKNKKSGDWGQDEMKGAYTLRVNCIRGADFKNPTNAPQRYINSKNINRLLEEDDIIVEISGGSPVQATGRSVYVSKGLLDSYGDNLTCSNFCQALTYSDKTIAPYFFYMWNMFYDNNIMFNYEGKTSGIKNLLIDMFLSNYWYLPDTSLMRDFATIIKSAFSQKDSNVKEINHLTHLRDSLLPMLMNGQVTIE